MTPSGYSRPAIVGGATIAFFVLIASLSLIWTPYDPTGINIANQLEPPSPTHWLGTDALGRDVLSMLMVGARISILVACFAVIIGLSLGVGLGLAASAFGGVLDEIIMRFGDIVFAFPAILLAILFAAVYGPGAVTVVIAIGIFNIPVFARLTRGAALPLWTSGYVLAAIGASKSRSRIAVEHILPNLAPLLSVQATIQFSLAVLAEAALSYIGLGVQPPNPSWGRMLAESQTFAGIAPWLAIFPGLMIFLFVLSLNVVGSAVRTHLNRDQKRVLQ